MRPITDNTISRFSLLQEESMNSVCTIDSYSGSSNSFGQVIETFTAGSPIACGINFNSSAKSFSGQTTLIEVEGILRLPISTVVTEKDKISISGSQFSIVGFPRKQNSCIVCNLKRVVV